MIPKNTAFAAVRPAISTAQAHGLFPRLICIKTSSTCAARDRMMAWHPLARHLVGIEQGGPGPDSAP